VRRVDRLIVAILSLAHQFRRVDAGKGSKVSRDLRFSNNKPTLAVGYRDICFGTIPKPGLGTLDVS
jgi:hypothetical protein